MCLTKLIVQFRLFTENHVFRKHRSPRHICITCSYLYFKEQHNQLNAFVQRRKNSNLRTVWYVLSQIWFTLFSKRLLLATLRRPPRLNTQQHSTVNKLLPLPQFLHRGNADGQLKNLYICPSVSSFRSVQLWYVDSVVTKFDVPVLLDDPWMWNNEPE